jgi:hypothetical protein
MGIKFRAMDYSRGMVDAKRILNRVVSGQNKVSDSKLKSKYEEAMRSRERVFEQMQEYVKVAEAFGMTTMEIAAALKAGGMGKNDINHVLGGVVPSFEITNSYMKEAQKSILATAPMSRRMETLRELQHRIRYLAQLQRGG